MVPFLKSLVGGRRAFHGLSVGETAAPDVSGECGVGKTPPQISRRKDQAASLGTEEKAPYPDTALFLTPCIKTQECDWGSERGVLLCGVV